MPTCARMRRPLIDRAPAHPIYVTQPSQPTKLQTLQSGLRGHFILSSTTDPDTVWGSCFETLTRVASHRRAGQQHAQRIVVTAARRPSISTGRRRAAMCWPNTAIREVPKSFDQPVCLVSSTPGQQPARRTERRSFVSQSLVARSLVVRNQKPAKGPCLSRLCAGLQCIMHSVESFCPWSCATWLLHS